MIFTFTLTSSCINYVLLKCAILNNLKQGTSLSKVDTLRAASKSSVSDAVQLATDAPDSAVDAADKATEVADRTTEVADKATDVPDPARESTKKTFEFTFATVGKIAKIICGLKATEAMGIDNIPTSVLKKGVEVLAGPISHLVNRSLAEGRVPEAFKVGKVFPVFKGKGKARDDPASYRPVSILPAMSKILKTLVKADLEVHLARVNGLPGAQYGFRPKRSCTTALAHAHAGWLTGAERGQVVVFIALDLSTAFYTVAAEQLLPKLQSLGVSGRALTWFKSYLTGGRHYHLAGREEGGGGRRQAHWEGGQVCRVVERVRPHHECQQDPAPAHGQCRIVPAWRARYPARRRRWPTRQRRWPTPQWRWPTRQGKRPTGQGRRPRVCYGQREKG
jgi:hypothetical protein